MTKELWSKMIATLEPGMTLDEAAAVFRRSPITVRCRLLENGYVIRKRTKHKEPAWVSNVNWFLPNIDISRKVGKSREMVRKWREKLGKPKVESRGRRLNRNGKPKGRTLMQVFADEERKKYAR